MHHLSSLEQEKLEKEYLKIVAKLPTNYPIFLPTEKVSLADKIHGVKIVQDIYKNRLHDIYRPKLRSLRDKYLGHKRCFIIGNGPSINDTDLSLLKDEITFAVNGFFLKMPELNWTPTFYVVEDHLVAEDRMESINALKGPTKLFPVYLGYCLKEEDDTIFYNHQPRKSYPLGFNFSTDASKITYTGCTVVYSCMQLAFYFGFSEIYLIGVDASYELPKDIEQGDSYGVCVMDMKSNDPNHFHPDYFGKGFRWHDPQLHKMVEAYQVARNITEKTRQRIYNATIGGKLEVFDRRDYYSIFSKQNLIISQEYFPKLLIIDSTPINQMSATGQLKRTFIGNWPQSAFLQIWVSGGRNAAIHSIELGQLVKGSQAFTYTIESIVEKAIYFKPDVIYFRPVDSELLFEIAKQVLSKIKKPMVIQIMDDWPERLRKSDILRFEKLDGLLRKMIDISAFRLCISEAMAYEYNARYGKEWYPLANGIDPAEFATKDWDDRAEISGKDPFIIRYMGGLAEDMSYESVKTIAKTVEELQHQYPVRFEIYTMDWYLDKAKVNLETFAGVFVNKLVDEKRYKNFLSEADVLVIAYNFDEKTIAYTKLSLANKMPECLASGAVLLAYGPSEIATIDYLKKTGCALVIDSIDADVLRSAIEKLILQPDYCKELSEKALTYVTHNLTKRQVQKKFRDYLLRAIESSNIVIPTVIGPFYPYHSAFINESQSIIDFLSQKNDDLTILNLGTSDENDLLIFLQSGWHIITFEPDIKKCELLLKSTSNRNFKSSINIYSQKNDNRNSRISNILSFNQKPKDKDKTFSSANQSFKTDIIETSMNDLLQNRLSSPVDFLKISFDIDGLSVLDHFPWNDHLPSVIMISFTNSNNRIKNSSTIRLAESLLNKSYSVYISDWYPSQHKMDHPKWKQLMRYPCELSEIHSPGSLIAYRNPTDESLIISSFRNNLKLSGDTDGLLDNYGTLIIEDVQYAGIITSGEAIRKRNAYHLNTPGPNNWIACRFVGDIQAEDMVSCKISFDLDTSSTLKLMLCRDGETQFESSSNKISLGIGKHVIDIGHKFKNSHEGLRIQISSENNSVVIRKIESEIKVNRGSKTIVSSSLKNQKENDNFLPDDHIQEDSKILSQRVIVLINKCLRYLKNVIIRIADYLLLKKIYFRLKSYFYNSFSK